jgi:hypothetical protein
MARRITVMPAVPVRDLDTAIAFHGDRLGFTVGHRESGGVILVRDGAALHLTRLDDETWRARPAFLAQPVKVVPSRCSQEPGSYRIEVSDVRATRSVAAGLQRRLRTDPIRGALVIHAPRLAEQAVGVDEHLVGVVEGRRTLFSRRQPKRFARTSRTLSRFA